MHNHDAVITGLGVVAANGIGKDHFWTALEKGRSGVSEIFSFEAKKFPVRIAAEIKNFDPKKFLELKSLRNLDRGTLFLLSAASMALKDAGLKISPENTNNIGVATGTTFTHLWSIVEFDREVFKEGIDFASPALFPSTVINAVSSQVSIAFGIRGFNATVSSGYTSGMEALRYALIALDTAKAKQVICGAVDALTASLFFAFHKLGYMAGLKGEALSCPFDKRRNGPVLGEAAAVFCVEKESEAKAHKAKIFARIKSIGSFFDASKMGRIALTGEGLEKAIIAALDKSGISPAEIDYVSSCANSSSGLDKTEARVLKKIFGRHLDKLPVSSIKSMLGETFSASSTLQIASCIGAMERGIIPPTINYKTKDPDCDLDCVPNKARKKNIKLALVTSFGPGGYNSACILEKYKFN
ncbi:MAG: beta-ketoacyl-[acyl-carrier-protein] synthase family protein [Candidatus Omnitrophica bacterium]|nr:beta-ketoacyl-[acyl-carrier-protein] synthase family protein [Candidatus Omnitrophota bacterium]